MKKGIFYSLSAVLLLVIIALVFHFSIKESSLRREITTEEIKFETVSEYVEDFEKYYLKNSLAVSSKHALSEISTYVSTSGPVPDLRTSVQELVTTGSSGGMSMDSRFTVPSIVRTFQDLLPVNITTDRLDINVGEITQPDPWTTRIVYDVNFEFEALDSSWFDILTKDVTITVYGFEDPEFHQVINKDYWIVHSGTNCFLMKLGHACDVDGVRPQFVT